MPEKTLVEEIIENARSDRKRLEAVANGLTHGFGQLGDSEGDGEALDPEVSAAFAEEIAKVTDSLSKINQQLVELVKIDIKKMPVDDKPKPDGSLSKNEKESIYDELSGPDIHKELN
jgi:hypothetical protein